MFKQLIILVIVCYLCYLRGYADAPIKTEQQIIKEIQNRTEFIINSTVCVNYTNKMIQREMIRYNTLNRTISLTNSQYKRIMNMRPSDCEGTGCSFGYVLAKYDCMDILEMNHTKFHERPSINFDPQYENIEYIPIKEDDFGKYIRLNGSWMLFSDYRIFTKKEICRSNNTKNFLDETEWTMIKRDGELYLREV